MGVCNNPPDYLSSTLWGAMIIGPTLIAPLTFMVPVALARSLMDSAECVRGDLAAHDWRMLDLRDYFPSPLVLACRCTVLGAIVLAVLVATDPGPRGVASRLIVAGCQVLAFFAVWMIRRRLRGSASSTLTK